MTSTQKLLSLRAVLKEAGVEGFIIPRADEYQGEYVPASAERLKWLTGFTGSAGFAIVLMDRAVVMSDGRYSIQIKQQVDATLFETADSTKTSAAEWLSIHAKGQTIGLDSRLHTPREVKALQDKGVRIKILDKNPLDAAWSDRPSPPSAMVEAFPLQYAGQTVQDKLDEIAAVLTEKKGTAFIMALPDSIAWTLNIRSSDIPHIPVALSYAIAHADGTMDWFIHEKRLSQNVIQSFGNRVSIHAPQDLEGALAKLKGRVLVDERRTSLWFCERLKAAGIETMDTKDPSIPLKAKKNRAEQNAMRAAHVRDGVGIVKFLKWFSAESLKGTLTEMDVESKLEEFRRVAPEYRDSSFDTIAGFGPHGAIVHYRATPQSNARIEKGNLLLLDSGAQYADGTTDITRTLAVGQPSEAMKEHYTLVLKGHIALASARFPQGTTGAQVDMLARTPLWQKNLDYAHGTGHGVGCYLSVHEEATSFSPRGLDPVEAGMIISNEPGFYQEGAYGIRLENLVLAFEDGVCPYTGKTMLAFETITLAPFDKNCIKEDMLTEDEKFWLAQYHKRVYAEISPHLDKDTADWLLDSQF